MNKNKRIAFVLCMALLQTMLFSTIASVAESGDVTGAIEGTWPDASSQIKTVVNRIIFTAITFVNITIYKGQVNLTCENS